MKSSRFFDYQVGDNVPRIDLYEDSPANKVNLADFCANKKVVLFAVPGAFTPGCSKVNICQTLIAVIVVGNHSNRFLRLFSCILSHSLSRCFCICQTHLPGYVENAEKLKADGANEIVCVSVNDPFVLSAWGKEYNASKFKKFKSNKSFCRHYD